MKWFANINTIEELKKAFRALVKINHPDIGGNLEDMKEINNEYEKMFAAIEKNVGVNKEHSVNDGYREAISKMINLQGLEIELIGSWLWVGGNTYPHKTTIKEAGCTWHRTRKLWYLKPEGEGFHRGSKDSTDNLRSKYGSTVIKGGPKGLN